jgi:hypothetical protein
VGQENPRATETLLYTIERLDLDSLIVVPAEGEGRLTLSRAE